MKLRRDTLLRIVLLLVVGGFLYALLRPSPNAGLAVGDVAPNFQLSDLSGRTLQLSDYRGKVVLVNFWATWCPPCVEEAPSLNRLAETFGPKGLEVLAVSVDDDEQALRDFVAKNGLKMTVLQDGGKKVSASYQTFKYPETYVLDRQGRLLQKVIGGLDWTSPDTTKYFEQILSR